MKMRSSVAAFLLFSLLSWVARAEALKKGRVLCEGKGCDAVNVPTGSMLGGAWDALQDLQGRVAKRVDAEGVAAPAKPPSVSAVKKNRRHDQIRTTMAAPVIAVGDEDSNLPIYFAGVDRRDIEASERVIFVPKRHDPRLKGLKSGDVVWAVVEQEITASPEVPTPVRAIATSGPFKGAYFVGEATLDRELKRVLFNFNKLRVKNGDSVYVVKAAGLSPRGSIGLEGEYVSQIGKFFIAELASAAATGFVDSTINRNQTALGTFVQEPSLAKSGKAATVTALAKTTDRLAESVKSAPEYTRIKGYQEIQVMIQDDPVESGF